MEAGGLAALPRHRPETLPADRRRRLEEQCFAGVRPFGLDDVLREALERHLNLRGGDLAGFLVHPDHVEPAVPGARRVAPVAGEDHEAAVRGPARPAGLVAVDADLVGPGAIGRHQPDVVGLLVGVEDDPAPVGGPLHALVLGVGLPHDAPGLAVGGLDVHWDRAEVLGNVRVVDVVRHVPPAPEGERDLAAVGAPGRRLRLEGGQRFGRTAFCGDRSEEDAVVLALEDDLAARAHRRGVGVPREPGEPGAAAAAHPAHPEVEETAVAGDAVDHPLAVG